MTYYHDEQEVKGFLSLRDATTCDDGDVLGGIARTIMARIERDQCHILEEGSEETTFHASRAWEESFYIRHFPGNEEDRERVVILFSSDREIWKLCDSVKIVFVASIIAAMASMGYTLRTHSDPDGDAGYLAYHKGCELVFDKL